jgi:hypothetical protein
MKAIDRKLTRFMGFSAILECLPRRQKGTPSDARATGIRRPTARRFGICPSVLCRRPCTNRLTEPSNYDRTQHEHGRSLRSKGCNRHCQENGLLDRRGSG